MAVYLELLNVSAPYDPIHYSQYVNDNLGSPEIFKKMNKLMIMI